VGSWGIFELCKFESTKIQEKKRKEKNLGRFGINFPLNSPTL
jgi:hypothetical protein